MAGYTTIYCVGGAGGYEGGDGINPILFQIWQGKGERAWLEVHYFDPNIQPLGSIRNIVPHGPDSPTALLDACLAFFPCHFASCPSLPQVQDALRAAQRLDFSQNSDQGVNAIPPAWNQLRIEAAPLLEQLFIVKGELHPVHFPSAPPAPFASAPSRSEPGANYGAADSYHVESMQAPDDIGGDAGKELFGDYDKGEDVGPVG